MSRLYLVPTPIGNLEDMTFRAVRVLKEVSLILAEDTRTSGKLLKHFEIKNRLQAFHIHNEHQALQGIIEFLEQGNDVALVTDAGTPAISDPGFLLVRACIENQIDVECLPGATAFVPALVQSGFPNNQFYFEGFLPHKKGRQTRLKEIAELNVPVIFYESPHRLIKTLEQFAEFYGSERKVSVSRELTKMHEENVRGTLTEVIAHFTAKSAIKGEIVIVLNAPEKQD
ncbi:MAG: 16S rRNA (cytidine(1402)-2'-O)-methyltransferase [Bacteroidales bacterium]|nr:16S rRNA (cytidine(1402)-2'-O)-methyltransferase [Bacteroidales bacterium]